jgi:hypothetical protein
VLDLRNAADGRTATSFSNRMRSRRFAIFESLVASLPRPLKIIDLGGTNEFWEQRGWADRDGMQVVTVNLEAEERRHENIIPIQGDVTAMSDFEDGSFDVAFSNSVIEHLFTIDQQRAMAREVVRLAKAYWVQTPNYWFPVEPHFHMIGWQWMPENWRVGMLRRRRCGWRGPCPDPEKAKALVREIRLMKRAELQALFPAAKIWGERFAGLVKSWVVHSGFPITIEAAGARA